MFKIALVYYDTARLFHAYGNRIPVSPAVVTVVNELCTCTKQYFEVIITSLLFVPGHW